MDALALPDCAIAKVANNAVIAMVLSTLAWNKEKGVREFLDMAKS
jgi:hypothetical protein